MLIALNIESFTSVATFKTSVSEMLGQIRKSKRRPGTSEVRIPGDGGYSREIRIRKQGVMEIAPEVIEELTAVAANDRAK